MKERERLIELLNNVGGNVLEFPTNSFIEALADYLLANCVIVMPCKVGDTVYWVTAWDSYATQKDHKGIVNTIMVNDTDIYFSTQYQTLKLSDYRRTWFVNEYEQKTVIDIMQKARKEAERALQEVQE